MIPVRWAIPHLCGMPKPMRDKRLLLMFRGYFDECNKNAADVRFIMSGWIGRVEQWEVFTDAWQTVLSDKPAIEYFKGSEANTLGDEFLRFSSPDRDAKKLALAEVIRNSGMQGYVVTVPHDILGEKPSQLKKWMGTRVYDWAFMALVPKVIIDLLERGERSKVDFVFDGCSELRACIESYERQRNEWPPSMRAIAGEVIPGDDKILAGLQAADFLAGEHSVYLETGNKEAAYLSLENASSPIVEFPASPSVDTIKAVLQYATEVYQRWDLVSGMLRDLKAMGVKLEDFK